MMMKRRNPKQQQDFVQIQVPPYWQAGEAVHFSYGNKVFSVHCPVGTRPGDVLNLPVPPRGAGLVRVLVAGFVQEVKAGILQGLRESVAEQVGEEVLGPLTDAGVQGFASLFLGSGDDALSS